MHTTPPTSCLQPLHGDNSAICRWKIAPGGMFNVSAFTLFHP